MLLPMVMILPPSVRWHAAAWIATKIPRTFVATIGSQINKERVAAHHDALEFPDGEFVLLTRLCEGQEAVVLQLPAQLMTASETESQKRLAYAG